MIFYFSGTGNSKHVAKCMSDDKLINIGDANKATAFTYEVTPGESLGFICPVYYSGIPKLVLDFIKNLKLNGTSDYVYGILTHGGGPGGAGSMLQKALFKKGIALHACFDVEMTSNYIRFGDLRPEEVLLKNIEDSAPLIVRVKKSVDAKERSLPHWSKLDKMLTSSMMVLCDKNMSAKKYYADEGCIGCGKCAKNCPTGIIRMQEGKPVWEENKCVRCMACLSCEHVQYGKATINRRRYTYEKYAKKD